MNRPLLGFAGLIAAGGVAVGVYVALSDGGGEEAVQDLPTATTEASPDVAVASPTPRNSDYRIALLPGVYEISYPASWSEAPVSDDPYVTKFFLESPREPNDEAFADLEGSAYENRR